MDNTRLKRCGFSRNQGDTKWNDIEILSFCPWDYEKLKWLIILGVKYRKWVVSYTVEYKLVQPFWKAVWKYQLKLKMYIFFYLLIVFLVTSPRKILRMCKKRLVDGFSLQYYL